MATQPQETPTAETALQEQAHEAKESVQEAGKKVAAWPAQAWGEVYRFMEGMLSHDFPPVDIIERGNEILVYAELPGVRKEDITVTVGEASVTIKGSISHEEVEGQYHRREIRRQDTFSRTLSLPVEIDPPNGKAKFEDNMLELVLPKSTRRHTLQVE